jgi:hypothetical protein
MKGKIPIQYLSSIAKTFPPRCSDIIAIICCNRSLPVTNYVNFGEKKQKKKKGTYIQRPLLPKLLAARNVPSLFLLSLQA